MPVQKEGVTIKLRDDILTHRVDEDYITIFTSDDPDGFHGVLRSNEAANFIMECLKSETTEAGILEKMQQEYDGDPEEMLEDIRAVLNNLRKANALTE